MIDNSTIIALVAILGLSAVAAVVYGNRYRKRRRAERLRRRGYNDHNRDRPKLVVDQQRAQSPRADNIAQS